MIDYGMKIVCTILIYVSFLGIIHSLIHGSGNCRSCCSSLSSFRSPRINGIAIDYRPYLTQNIDNRCKNLHQKGNGVYYRSTKQDCTMSLQSTTTTIDTSSKHLRILCLHGYLTNSNMFEIQLREVIQKTRSFAKYEFMDSPHELNLGLKSSNSSSSKRSTMTKKCRWWTAIDKEDDVIYDGIEESIIRVIHKLYRTGPYDVIIGHSQGASLVLLLDFLLLDSDFTQTLDVLAAGYNISLPSSINFESLAPTLRVLMSGFVPRDGTYGARIRKCQHIEFGIKYPSIHMFSSDDSVNPVSNSVEAMSMYSFPKLLVRETGGHDPPLDEAATTLASFLQDAWKQKNRKKIVLED